MLEDIPQPTPLDELSVLIIDNQALLHDVIVSAFRDIGVKRVHSAVNAFHALRLCEQLRFDVFLIAFNVSDDKDGFHLFEELRYLGHMTEDSTVVFLSAETSSDLVNCIVELQPDDFWVKPLDKQRILKRLEYLVKIRQKFHKLFYFLKKRDFSTAIYYAERHLRDASVTEYHPRLKRIIGDCYLQLRDYETAEQYYNQLLTSMDQAWVHIGLVKSLLRQDKTDAAELLAEDLLLRQDTRFLTYDLLAQYHIEKAEYDKAYEQVKQASKLAPRNIERNKRLWNLARLNHDRLGQLAAVQNMAKYARNSIHDSPELHLNVIRSSLDLATVTSDAELAKLVRKIEEDLADMSQKTGVGKQLDDQVQVIQARLCCIKKDKKAAEKIMKAVSTEAKGASMEDNLDKMKAFHELGMKEQCLSILDQLRAQIEGDTFSSRVVEEYLKQESIERKEILFTTAELKHMAAVNYKENRMLPAYNNLKQAMTLSPDSCQIALSVLKVLAQLRKKEPLTAEQYQTAMTALDTLQQSTLATSQLSKRDQYLQEIGLETAPSAR